MKTLLILRHAKSSWGDAELPDHERPLNERGRRDAPRMGALLETQGLVPDHILSSTATRARLTAEAIVASSGYGGNIELNDDLYAADVRDYFACIHGIGCEAERALLVGHNPTVEELVTVLTGEDETMPTAALAQIALPVDRWDAVRANGAGKLVQVWRPRELMD